MSGLGTSIAQSVAGINQAERVATRDTVKKAPAAPKRIRPDGDQLDLEVEDAQAADAVRNLKGNAQEETDEDRQRQDHYRPQHADDPATPHKRIDVQG